MTLHLQNGDTKPISSSVLVIGVIVKLGKLLSISSNIYDLK